MLKNTCTFLLLIWIAPLSALEMVIGEEYVKPGIVFIFEGAIKDDVTPYESNLAEQKTDVHLEARVNWADDSSKDVPKGTPRGGFVPYLTISAEVTNERTGEITFVDLLPHINLIDSFHYARNMTLPGKRDDLYSVKFIVGTLDAQRVALHKDWRDAYGPVLMKGVEFTYKKQDFKAIAEASRR